MTYERDEYMRRQEADHDLLRMRQPVQRPATTRDWIGERMRHAKRGRADLNNAANAAILAMDGNLSRENALLIARLVGEAFGLEIDR